MPLYNVTVRFSREFKISAMEALSPEDVQDQLFTHYGNNELNENMDVTCEDIEESDSDFDILKCKEHVEESDEEEE
jgi:hypothetical protein